MTKSVEKAYERIKDVVSHTPLEFNERLSKKYKAQIYLKREDLQIIRSYKIRGAYNRISLLTEKEREKGVVCASAGNHAQGVAYSCKKLKIKGYIYMPQNTPRQKVERVSMLGEKWVELVMQGDSFDEAYKEAKKLSKEKGLTFIHPFDDKETIAGQGTIAIEVLNDLQTAPDYFVIPVGGGGLSSGIASYVQNTRSKIIGAEPEGTPSMTESLKAGKVVTVDSLDKFVDGASVATVGKHSFRILKDTIQKMVVVPEGLICEEMINLYQNEGIVSEPAGALSISALEDIKKEIKGKTVVCILSGGNNDISRYAEIMERSLIYKGLKHYFVIEFPQRPGALRQYLDEVLGPRDDITFFEYMKKNHKEFGPALVGIELVKKEDLKPLIKNMKNAGFGYEKIDNESSLFRFIV